MPYRYEITVSLGENENTFEMRMVLLNKPNMKIQEYKLSMDLNDDTAELERLKSLGNR